MTAEAFAPAKINLTLHVTGQRADGYHLLDSLVVFADVGDRLQVTRAPDWSLRVTGPMAAGLPADDGNIVLRAARLAGGAPCAITLDKHLPLASGIGGGSSDAAACLRALARLDGRPLPDAPARLGADVPVCLAATPCRMQGTGDRLTPVTLPPLHAVLVNPGAGLPTPAVFAALARRDNPPMPENLPHWPDAAALIRWLSEQRNDMADAACRLLPEIATVLQALAATDGCLLARMSGSGATCFAIHDSPETAQAAARNIAAAHPRWWVTPVRLGAPPV